jgi:hypothetical protein
MPFQKQTVLKKQGKKFYGNLLRPKTACNVLNLIDKNEISDLLKGSMMLEEVKLCYRKNISSLHSIHDKEHEIRSSFCCTALICVQ